MLAIYHKTSQEVFILAGSFSGLVERDADELIADARGAVPRTVLGGKDVALVFGGKLPAFVEGHLQRSVVRMKEDVGCNDFVFQLGMLAGKTRILLAAHIKPRPTVEAPGLNVGDVV